jgi:hypothetical protein
VGTSRLFGGLDIALLDRAQDRAVLGVDQAPEP